jgi:hypothetical protein
MLWHAESKAHNKVQGDFRHEYRKDTRIQKEHLVRIICPKRGTVF